jgi:hypothetical protein
MKRYMARVSLLLLTSMLVSCGGDSGGGGGSQGTPSGGGSPGAPSAGNPPSGGNPPGGGNPGNDSGGGATLPSAGTRVEESDAAVSLSPGWTQSNSRAGWSGGAAVQSTVAGATASFTFTGTSVRWLGSRGRAGGIALVRVDGGTRKGVDLFEVDLFARPHDEFRTPAITIYGLSPGKHTLTIEVTGTKNKDARSNEVVVDAFEVEPQIVSHVQEADPDLTYSAGWTQADDGSWSGSGAFNAGEPPPGAKVTETAGATVTFKFRGTSVSWSGYSGPDAGIARVQICRIVGSQCVDGVESLVDTYSPAIKVQQVVFTASGLADDTYALTIEATGRKNDKSKAAKIFVDAFDVTTPGRRYEQGDPSINYDGFWNPHNDARVWSEGATATSNQAGASATFSFTGTSVSWIGCEKASAGGRAKIFLDGALEKEVSLRRPIPIEGYQRTIFRKDGLTNGPHTLRIEVTSIGTSYVVVDAFDVHP